MAEELSASRGPGGECTRALGNGAFRGVINELLELRLYSIERLRRAGLGLSSARGHVMRLAEDGSMRIHSRVGVWGCCWVAVLAVNVQGAEFLLVPIRASGSYTIVGDEIRLAGGGQRVFIELYMRNWGSNPPPPTSNSLKTFAAKIDGSGYCNGIGACIFPAVQPCDANNDDCADQFGPESICNVPAGAGQFCEPGFQDRNRADWVFGTNALSAFGVDISSPNYRYFAIRNTFTQANSTTPKYGGSLVLDVPLGAAGTYIIGYIEGADTTMQDANNAQLLPLILTTMKIVVQCASNANCNDGNACTTDVCNANGTCSNTNNYNPITHCCNPTTGTPLPLSDGDPCTDDVCNTLTGQVTHPPADEETPCGNQTNSQCDRPDSCDGAGNCNARLEPDGTACGSNVDTECNGADTCNGAGVCQTNIRDNTTPCGSQTSGLCDDPDKCNGLGACLTNNKPNGVPCSTGQFCIGDERCQNAVCTGGTPTNCADLLTCTTDSCNEGTDQCDHPQNAGTCLIDGVCYMSGDLRPGNTCEHCDPSSSTTSWTTKPDGSACNDGNACTGTGRPGIGIDTCTAGVCAGILDPQCNDQCEFSVPAIVGQNLSTNASAGDDGGTASCQNDTHADVWFTYTADCNGAVFISTTGSNLQPVNDPVLNVFTECPLAGGVEIACDDDSGAGLNAALVFSTTQGEDYFIRISGFQNNKGLIVMNLSPIGDCLIDGVCYLDGELNPANDCQACIPEISSTQWSAQPEGSACGNLQDTDCDSPDACDGAGVCEVNYKADGIPCSDEVPAVCEKNLCNTCTKNLCQSGVCTHPPEPAGLACGDQNDDDCDNPNTCNGGGGCANNLEGAGHACGDQSDTQCDNPDICDGVRSQTDGGCLSNPEIDGTPCDDEESCTGNDACDGGDCVGVPAVETPIVEGISGEYLRVTPQDSFIPVPVALRVTSPDWPCLNQYVSASGQLVAPGFKVFKLPSEWGAIVVYNQNIVPSSVYHVEAECGSYRSAPGIDSTWIWGDINNDGDVNVSDIALMTYAFQGYYDIPGRATFYAANIAACPSPWNPNNSIDVTDISTVVAAFKHEPYWCSLPCVP